MSDALELLKRAGAWWRYADIAPHLDYLYDLATLFPGDIYEFGVRDGGSTLAFLLAAKDGAKVHSCDIMDCRKTARTAHQVGVGAFLDPDRWKFTQARAETRINEIESIHFAFLDTSHTYLDTRLEVRLLLERLTPDGIIVLHDTELTGKGWMQTEAGGMIRCEYDVKSAVRDTLKHAERNFMFRNNPVGYGLGIVHRREAQFTPEQREYIEEHFPVEEL